MTFAEEVRTQHRRQGEPCSVCVALRDFTPEDAADLEKVLDDPMVSAASIMRAIKARGLRCGNGAIPKHRDGQCGGLRR
jgi:hypothetical protein